MAEPSRPHGLSVRSWEPAASPGATAALGCKAASPRARYAVCSVASHALSLRGTSRLLQPNGQRPRRSRTALPSEWCFRCRRWAPRSASSAAVAIGECWRSFEPLRFDCGVGVDADEVGLLGATVGELVWRVRWDDHDVPGSGLELLIAGLEREVAVDHYPRLVVGVLVQPGPLTRVWVIEDQ